MAEFVSGNYDENTVYTPEGAVLIVTFNDGVTSYTDTVTLDPKWGAALIKAIRAGNTHKRLDGCLPAGSAELRPESKHDMECVRELAPREYQYWLSRKPAA